MCHSAGLTTRSIARASSSYYQPSSTAIKWRLCVNECGMTILALGDGRPAEELLAEIVAGDDVGTQTSRNSTGTIRSVRPDKPLAERTGLAFNPEGSAVRVAPAVTLCDPCRR
jgi:hypothetical protein